MRLCFEERKHRYWIEDDSGMEIDRKVVSVSEITTAVTGKSFGLASPEDLRAARDRGKAIHEDVASRRFKTPEGIWFAKQLDFADFRSEVRGWTEIDGLAVAGTCDLISWPDLAGEVEIHDIKSEAVESRLYWTIQLALYRAIFAPAAPVRHAVLFVPKSGNFARVPIATLPAEKVREIIKAYKEGKILDESFLTTKPAPEAAEPTLELVVYKQDLGELTTNAKAILEAVKAKCASYKAENYGPENIAEAKRDKAELNNAATRLNAKRLEIEREFMRPFAEFKDTVTETVAAIKTASGLIDGVVKDVETREKDEKRKLIKSYFDGLKTDLVTFTQIFDAAWLNKTAKVKDAQAAIDAKLEKVQSDLMVLDRLGEPDAKALYLTTLDLESALKKADEIKANRERLAKIVAAKEEEARARGEAKAAESRKLDDARATAPLPAEDPMVIAFPRVSHPEPVTANEATGEILERTFRVRCTKDQLVALAAWMNERKISFEKVSHAFAS